MLLPAAIESHLLWRSPDGLRTLYYNDVLTWVVAVSALAWVVWLLFCAGLVLPA